MSPPHDALERIARLRAMFLDEGRGARALADYWRDDADLHAYDAVLGARIGWKWDAALAECTARGFPRADGACVLDFGCGSGIAARRFRALCGAGEVLCHDRSARAMEFAARRLRDEAPGGVARAVRDVSGLRPDVLLVSHVLGELDEPGLSQLRALIARSARIVVVEPGNRAVARRLSALRDELRADFRVVAPCTHAAACPTLATPQDWCHFFAPPPPQVFTDGDWVRTARAVGFDLRALPYSFLACCRPAAPAPAEGLARVLGRPQITSRTARVQVCDAAGLRSVTVEKRREPELWRGLKKHPETVRCLPDAGSPGDLSPRA